MTTTKKDHLVERYWLEELKPFIIKIENELIFDSLEFFCDKLNQLQKDDKYQQIEIEIEKYMGTIGWQLIKYSNQYNVDLFVTHLKRWSKIESLCDNNIKHPVCYYFKTSKYYQVLVLYLNLYRNFLKHTDNFNIFQNSHKEINLIDYMISSDNMIQNFSDENMNLVIRVIPEFIENEKNGVLDIIFRYIDMIPIINKYYNIKLNRPLKGRKLIQLIKNTKKLI